MPERECISVAIEEGVARCDWNIFVLNNGAILIWTSLLWLLPLCTKYRSEQDELNKLMDEEAALKEEEEKNDEEEDENDELKKPD